MTFDEVLMIVFLVLFLGLIQVQLRINSRGR